MESLEYKLFYFNSIPRGETTPSTLTVGSNTLGTLMFRPRSFFKKLDTKIYLNSIT